jgi:hypothetical protein
MNNEFYGGSATLDAHSYLDRHANGIPDVLDHNLEGVSYSGNPNWNDLKSGENGRIILPGAYGNSEFSFSAKWQEGSATVNNNYVVYTHPGAYVDVNMPFYLITDLTGFVIRLQADEEIGLRNVEMQLLDTDNKVVQTTETDEDGYYEFLQLAPNNYKVQASKDYLKIKGFTSDVIGTDVTTSGRGGYVELPSIILRRISKELGKGAEKNDSYIINEDNVDALVWSEDEEENRNYFTLPVKGKVKRIYSLTQQIQPETPELTANNETADIKRTNKNESAAQSTTVPEVLGVAGVITKLTEANSVLPQLSIKAAPLKSESSGKISEGLPETSSVVVTPLNKSVEKIDLNGWSIQFQATKAGIDDAIAKKNFSAIGALYKGIKVNGAGVSLHCIISDSFMSKETAKQLLFNSGLDGWVVQRKIYTNIKKIN